MIDCITPFEVYQEGNLFIACLYLSKDYEHNEIVVNYLLKSSLFVQVHGHIYGNRRWINFDLAKVIKKPERQIFIDQVNNFPQDPRKDHNGYTHCIFASSKVPISPKPLIGDGVILECELPNGLLPSYRGRAANISYYITLTVQGPEPHSKSFHYPIQIAGLSKGLGGLGNLSPQTYTIQHASLVGYALSSIPKTFFYNQDLNYISQSIDLHPSAEELRAESYDNTLSTDSASSQKDPKNIQEDPKNTTHSTNSTTSTAHPFAGIEFYHDLADPVHSSTSRQRNLTSKSFLTHPHTIACKISDTDYICTIHIGYGKATLGRHLPICLQFQAARQICYQVTMYLVQIERRYDDMLVEEKVLDTITKSTQYAYELFALFPIANDWATTFTSPLIKVEYKLKFEFILTPPTPVFLSNHPTTTSSSASTRERSQPPEEPLSFAIPLSMIYAMTPRNTLSTAYDENMDFIFTKQQLISICLENHVYKPFLASSIVNPDPIV